MLPRPVTALLLGLWALAPVTLGFKRTNIKFNKNTGGYQDIVVVVSEDLSAASCPQILDNIKVCAASNHSDFICFLSLVKCFIWSVVCQELMTKKDANYFEELKYFLGLKNIFSDHLGRGHCQGLQASSVQECLFEWLHGFSRQYKPNIKSLARIWFLLNVLWVSRFLDAFKLVKMFLLVLQFQ